MDSNSEDVDGKENDITIDFEASQDSANIHLEDFHNFKPPLTKAVLHYLLRQDLSGHDNSLGIMSDFIDTTILNTHSSGKRKLFIVGSSNVFIDLKIKNHVSLNIDGPITYIECSQLFGTQCSGWYSWVVFCPMECQGWQLGILQVIFALNVSNQI